MANNHHSRDRLTTSLKTGSGDPGVGKSYKMERIVRSARYRAQGWTGAHAVPREVAWLYQHENTWEPAENLKHAQRLVDEYNTREEKVRALKAGKAPKRGRPRKQMALVEHNGAED